jgi:hypothetical protein
MTISRTRVTKKGRVTACDSESWKFLDWRPREAFLSGFLVTRCHTVTPAAAMRLLCHLHNTWKEAIA